MKRLKQIASVFLIFLVMANCAPILIGVTPGTPKEQMSILCTNEEIHVHQFDGVCIRYGFAKKFPFPNINCLQRPIDRGKFGFKPGKHTLGLFSSANDYGGTQYETVDDMQFVALPGKEYWLGYITYTVKDAVPFVNNEIVRQHYFIRGSEDGPIEIVNTFVPERAEDSLEKTATIIIYSPPCVKKSLTNHIFLNNKFFFSLDCGKRITVKLNPGEYSFCSSEDQYAIMRTSFHTTLDIKAGEKYYFRSNSHKLLTFILPSLFQVDPKVAKHELDELKPVEIDCPAVADK